MTRNCTKCGEEKPLEDFSPHAHGKYGRQPRCKVCCVAANKKRYQENLESEREKSRLRAAEYREKHPERVAASRERWAISNPDKDKETKEAWRQAHREEIRESQRVRYERDPVKHRAWALANRLRHRLAQRKSHLKRNFGMTVEQFDAMVLAQDGRCAICSTADPGKRAWHIDHDHSSGVIRGLLCNKCNKGLGYFCDNPGTILAAERYLQKHRRLKAVR